MSRAPSGPGLPEARLAVVGDVHRRFDGADAQALDAGGYDAVLFVGDLAGYRWQEAHAVAGAIARLRTPAFVVPGNHDAALLPHLASEVFDWPRLRRVSGRGMARRVARLRAALGPATLCGLSAHPLPVRGGALHLVAGRPHSMGGPRLAFPRYLGPDLGVRSIDEAAARLRDLVDASPADRALLFLAHNGPRGLGARRDDPWGCDFRPEEGDWGDADLEAAVRHAVAQGRRVAAVVAGHMHHALRGGGTRRTEGLLAGVPCFNAAQVPRHRRGPGRRRASHHLRLELGPDGAVATPVWS